MIEFINRILPVILIVLFIAFIISVFYETKRKKLPFEAKQITMIIFATLGMLLYILGQFVI